MIRVIEGGIRALVEDWPGRTHYRRSGVSLSGAIDDMAHRAANLLVGNPVGDYSGNPMGEACIEISGGGFEAEFTEDTVTAITGADMDQTINDASVPLWESVRITKGDKIKFGPIKELGFTSYLGIAGGIDVPLIWGSKSTCTKEAYGGFKGRQLQAGDELKLGKSKINLSKLEGRRFKKGLIPQYQRIWELRAIPGPNSAPDYFTEEGMEMWFSQPFQIDHNSNRHAYRLRHPKPLFARKTGGEGGVHPSMVILQSYRDPGSLNVGGDFACILFRDSVAIGGYVVALTVINADLWKIGQAAPVRDSIKFVYCMPEEATQALIEHEAMFTEAMAIEEVAPVTIKPPVKVAVARIAKVLAPMPALVARVTVNKGDTVKEGDVVVVLNVMKIEIAVCASEDGKVKEILVKEWDEVDTGSPMIVFE